MSDSKSDPEAHDDGYFGETVARHYDEGSPERFSAEELDPTVDLLAELAGDGRALELAVGTGRVALPLAARGVEVAGIDLSRAMVARLRAKPHGDAIAVTVGDMATTRVDGEFSLVYLVFNTINNLVTQDAQVDCFCNAAAHLAPGGRFLVETLVPDLRRLPPGERYVAFSVSDEHMGIEEYDVVNQRSISHHLWLVDGVGRRNAVPFRYAWPAEFDLMARIAGLRLESRWGDWRRSPFTAESDRHVSVWVKPEGATDQV
ncbi:MAG: class I SAM-dependent methyltransferase [Actinomycetota bacterium]